MRARVGQTYIFFDGKVTKDYVYKIRDINKTECYFELQEVIEKKSEGEIELVLYQALPNKLSKLETIIQKCSEVGYRKVLFFQWDNSQKLILSDSKKERLNKISIEATEQCWWNHIMKLSFDANVEQIERNTIFCHTESPESQLISEIQYSGSINIVVWPEWWFSHREIEFLRWKWAQKVYLWPRVLRCETVAPLVWFYISQK